MGDLNSSSEELQEAASVQEARLFGYADLDTTQIVSGLDRLFTLEQHRVVFWNDPDREFTEVVSGLAFDHVTVIRLDEVAALAVKIQVEHTDPMGRYLLYMPFEEPAPEQDWLLDLRLYGGKFRADRASMLLAELGLGQQQSLRAHLNKRLKFLSSKERISRLTKLVIASDDEAAIDRKMLALLARADHAEAFAIVTALFHDLANQGHGLGGASSAWEDIVKFNLSDSFWVMTAQTFGYQEETPKLRGLLLRLLVTDFAQSLKAHMLPAALRPHLLPDPFVTNAVVCLNQWRDSAARGKSYDLLSAAIAENLKLPQHLSSLSAEALVDVVTFLDVEKRITSELRDRVIQEGVNLKAEEIRNVISRRQNSHWVSASLPPTSAAPRKAFYAAYQALEAAAGFAELLQAHPNGFTQSSAHKLYDCYASDLYRFDQRYRQFCEAAAVACAEGWDLLKSLQEKIEADYSNGFLLPLALAWGNCIEQDLLPDWRLEGIDNQYRFFERQVKPLMEREGQKVFVIISDAFRYEAAQELMAELNGRYRFQATLTTQLSVLPSYTALGMAALLPHKKLSYGAKGDVLADGKSTSGMENRKKLLEGYDGMAVSADTLLAMKREEGRAFIKNCRVVYIYHDTVDATGDKASTEDETFQAVRRAIEELGNLARHLINSLNGTHVIVTADHGFLFQQDPPSLTEKSKLEDKPSGAVIAKKRYLLGHNLPTPDNAYHGKTEVTAQAEGEMDFWIPKGCNRFHFTGGAKFIHGGAMPQEIMTPIIAVHALRDEAAEKTRIRTVTVHILGARPKITTNRHRFQLIQTEAVSARLKPATLQVGVYDGDTPVTNVETVTFDSSSSDMNQRMKWVSLVLKSQIYDKKKTYALVLRSTDDNIEHQRAEVTIDLAFNNDF